MIRTVATLAAGLVFGAALHASASTWDLLLMPGTDVKHAYARGFAAALVGLKNIVDKEYNAPASDEAKTFIAYGGLSSTIEFAGDCADHISPAQIIQFVDQHQGDEGALIHALTRCTTTIQ